MRRKLRALVALAISSMFAVACSNNGTTTQPSSVPQTLPSLLPVAATGGPPCEALFGSSVPPSIAVSGNGGLNGIGFFSIPPAGATNCSPMTIVSNAAFITVTSIDVGLGGRFPNSSVRFVVAPNETSMPRSGTITIGNQAVTINQERGQLTVSLSLFDPARTSAATTACYIRGPASQPTTCIVQASVATTGGPSVVSYTWTVQYSVGPALFKQVTTTPQITFTGACGQAASTPDGAVSNLFVEVILTDSSGNTVTIESGLDGQPSFQVRLFTCGS